MPTAQPRYQVTDTGRVRTLLDSAAKAWPELAGDRKRLLLRLMEFGSARLASAADAGLDAELRKHAGEWVAVRDGRVLFAGADVAGVVHWLREQGHRAEQLYRVPMEIEELSGEHGRG